MTRPPLQVSARDRRPQQKKKHLPPSRSGLGVQTQNLWRGEEGTSGRLGASDTAKSGFHLVRFRETRIASLCAFAAWRYTHGRTRTRTHTHFPWAAGRGRPTAVAFLSG